MLAKRDEEMTGTLKTRRLALVPLAPAHAPLLHPLMDDWDVVRMLAVVPWPLTLGDVEDHARRQLQPDRESDEFAIFAGEALIGACGVKRPGSGDPPRVMPRLSYWLGRRYWGRGYATETLAALVDFAFERHPQERVGAGVFHDNPASRRDAGKAGFSGSAAIRFSLPRARRRGRDRRHAPDARTAWEEGRR